MSSENLSSTPTGYTQAIGALMVGDQQGQQYLQGAEQQAAGTDSAYLQQAMGYLNNLNSQAQNALSPQVDASYSALTQYMNLLGINTPQGGYAAIPQLNQVNSQITDVQDQIAGLTNQLNQLGNPTGDWQKNAQNAQTSWGPGGLSEQRNNLEQQLAQLQTQQTQDQQLAQVDPHSSGNALAQLSSTPGYQFAQQQGDLGVQSAAAAGGYLNSGQTSKAMANYNQQLATTTYQNAVNNALQASGLLQQATSQSATMLSNQGTVGAQLTNSTGQAIGGLQNQLGVNQASTVMSAAGGMSAIYAAEGAQQQATSASQQGSQAYSSGFRST